MIKTKNNTFYGLVGTLASSSIFHILYHLPFHLCDSCHSFHFRVVDFHKPTKWTARKDCFWKMKRWIFILNFHNFNNSNERWRRQVEPFYSIQWSSSEFSNKVNFLLHSSRIFVMLCYSGLGVETTQYKLEWALLAASLLSSHSTRFSMWSFLCLCHIQFTSKLTYFILNFQKQYIKFLTLISFVFYFCESRRFFSVHSSMLFAIHISSNLHFKRISKQIASPFITFLLFLSHSLYCRRDFD
jgi:hypothetical protein